MFVKDDDYWEAKKESKNEMTKVIKVWSGKEEAIHDAGFANGADFGYQKGIKAKINTTTISDCPIKDEWHYVKDGDYPKEYEDLWICFITEDDMKDYVRGWYEYDFDNDKHIFKYVNEIDTQYLKDVYAWQTLVPPKE